MIDIVVKNFLESRIRVPVLMEFPEDGRARFVLLEIEHNPRENHMDSAIIVAESYDASKLEAAKLNELVKSALDELTELDIISSSRRGGDYYLPDDKNKRYRYQAVQNITHY